MFRRRQASPDSSLLEQVTDANEVSLGSYPEAVLAVTGADVLESVFRPSGCPVYFADLDQQTRGAAMQAALDGLIADGTVSLPAGAKAKAAVSAAKAGKLAVAGALGELCRLIRPLSRFRSAIILDLKAAGDHELVAMPPGVPPPGPEFCYWVPFQASSAYSPVILLVVRPDWASGTRSFTLRTIRAQINRIADFLFCDTPSAGVLAPRTPRHADVGMLFRTGGGYVTGDRSIIRTPGDDLVTTATVVGGRTIFNKIEDKDPGKIKRLSRTELVNVMVAQFVSVTARSLSADPPRKLKPVR